MMRSLIVLFAVALLLGSGSARAAPKVTKAVSPCVPIEHETIVCKVGERVFRIIHDSVSPSRRYAVGWSIEGGDDDMNDLAEDPRPEDKLQERSFSTDNRDHVWNYLIRLADGKILAKLDGRHFGDRQRYNHYSHQISWSPDERYFAQITDWRFGSSFASAYRIGAGDRVEGPFRMTPPARRAAAALLKGAKDKDYVSKVNAAFEIKSITNDGTMEFGVGFAEAKEEGFNFDMTVRLKAAGGRLTGEVKSARQEKG